MSSAATIMIADRDRLLPAPPRSPSLAHSQLDAMPEEVLQRVLTYLASDCDFKSLARLCCASRHWAHRASDDKIWRATFLARWAMPVPLADSPNILDRGQTTSKKIGAGRRGVSISSVPWKTLVRDRSALSSFRSRLRTRPGENLKDRHLLAVRAICIDAYSIVTGGSDALVKIWDRATRKCVNTFGALSSVFSVACHSSTVVCGTNNGLVQVWDAKTGLLLETLRGLSGFVEFVYVNSTLIVASDPDNVNVWSPSTKSILKTFTKGGNSKVDVHNSLLAFSISDNTVQVVSLPSGDIVHSEHFESKVQAIQLENSTLAVGLENRVGVCDIQSGKRFFVDVYSKEGFILSLYDGTLLIKTDDCAMQIRDLKNGGQLLYTFPPRLWTFSTGIVLHASGIAAGDPVGHIVMWDFDKGIPYAHEFMELKT
ncbi:WD40-repeat-containing domain protein [Zopfochytrium polystomum]|nr:WD40-repeat-containing domain protein [Zopfochytrium polystomum]